jgi:hypothetical protein
MIKSRIIRFFILFQSIILVTSCDDNSSGQFNIPRSLVGDQIQLFNPLLVDQLIGNPYRTGSIWNDSVIERYGISKLELISKGGNNPDDIRELITYHFDGNGTTRRFFYSNFLISEDVLSQTLLSKKKRNIQKISATKLHGDELYQELFYAEKEKVTILYAIKTKTAKKDTIFIEVSDKTHTMRIDKMKGKISGIHFVVPANYTRTKLIRFYSKHLKEKEGDQKISKTVTLMKGTMPVSCSTLDSNWKIDQKIKEWRYFKSGELKSYFEWRNHNLINTYSFRYSPDHLLRSVLLNNRKYSLYYH